MFSKDPQQKSKQEQLAVTALGVVFLVIFLRGPAKSLGLFRGRSPQPVTIDPSGVVPQPTTETLQNYQRQLDAVLDAPAAPKAGQPSGAPGYTAYQLRNPFQSLIPAKAPEPVVVAAASPLVTAPVALPEPPPLDIQGLLWGGELPQAIIGHQVYRVGDSVSGMTITEIDYHGITVEYHGESIVYPVSESPMKIPKTVGAGAGQRAQWR